LRASIAVIFIYLGSTISVLKPYADYVAVYMLGARTVFLALVFSVGCYYWCCLRLVAPKQAGSISEWVSKVQARCKAFSLDYGKLGKGVARIWCALSCIGYFNARQTHEFGMRLTVLVNCSCSTERLPADVLVIPATAATFNTFHGLNILRRSWELPKFGVYQPVLGILCLMNCAQLFRMAWKWNIGGENMTAGNDDSQSESDDVTPLGEYKDDDTTNW
jgi:hypothetical protein